MPYEQFLEEVVTRISKRLGEGYLVRSNSVLKNNSVKLDGLVILNQEDKVAPNIYLNDYHERFIEGEELENICNNILSIYFNSDSNLKSQYDIEFDYEALKDKIYFRIVNFKDNQKLIEDIPYIPFLDLAVTFHCLIRDDEEGIGSIRITKECIKNWNVTVTELMKQAKRNTPILFPPSIRSMEDVIGDLICFDNGSSGIDHVNDDTYISAKQRSSTYEGKDNRSTTSVQRRTSIDAQNEMYIVSNTRGINGASVMLYKDVIRNFALLMNRDFFILPSSIHEIILVPYHTFIKKELLEEMVFDINHTQVAKEEVLSNQVYYYNRKRNSFES